MAGSEEFGDKRRSHKSSGRVLRTEWQRLKELLTERIDEIRPAGPDGSVAVIPDLDT
ncbi:MAG: hypothetical protein WBH47_01475 [Streptosporangiaceae bacterium]